MSRPVDLGEVRTIHSLLQACSPFSMNAGGAGSGTPWQRATPDIPGRHLSPVAVLRLTRHGQAAVRKSRLTSASSTSCVS